MPRLGADPFAARRLINRRLTHGAGHGTEGADNLLQHCVADHITTVDQVGKARTNIFYSAWYLWGKRTLPRAQRRP